MARGHGTSWDTAKAGVVVMKVLLGVVVVRLTVRRLEDRDVVGGKRLLELWGAGQDVADSRRHNGTRGCVSRANCALLEELRTVQRMANVCGLSADGSQLRRSH